MFALFLSLIVAVNAASAADYAHVGPTPPPHGYPAIKSFAISTTQIHAGRPVHGSVETSANVHYVEVRVDYHAIAMRQDGPGKFSLDYTVPWWLPPWLRHGYDLQVVARSIDGVETARDIAITVH